MNDFSTLKKIKALTANMSDNMNCQSSKNSEYEKTHNMIFSFNIVKFFIPILVIFIIRAVQSNVHIVLSIQNNAMKQKTSCIFLFITYNLGVFYGQLKPKKAFKNHFSTHKIKFSKKNVYLSTTIEKIMNAYL